MKKAENDKESTLTKLLKLRPGKMIRICPGKRHAWFESAVGPVRKPCIAK